MSERRSATGRLRAPSPPGRPPAHTGLVARDPDGLRRMARRILGGLDNLLPRLAEAYQREIPEYARLDEAALRADVLPTSREVVEEFFSPMLEGGEADLGVLLDFRATGRRRLELGVPLDSALHAFRIMGREVWNAVVAATRPGDEHALAGLAGQWIEYVDRASSSFTQAYLAASQEQLRRVDTRRSAALDALLAAQGASELAAVAGQWSLALAPAYLPVLVAGDSSTPEQLMALAPPHTLAAPRHQRVLAVLPAGEADLASLARALAPAVVAHGDPAPPGAALAEEVARTESLLDAAEACGRPGGLVGPNDLLVEQLVASNPRIAALLRTRMEQGLGGLAGDRDAGHLVATLRRYLDCGSVPMTAQQECVHANTVAYRLKRVRELTGLDPRVPAQAAELLLALTAADVVRTPES